MKIVIPMSGTGNRFMQAGYTRPKPLIEVDNKPIIEHVVGLFPGEEDFIFICNQDHLDQTDMREILERIAPKGQIISIAPHKKGPVYAVAQINDLIDDDEEVIVNYCDFGTYWDYPGFLSHTRGRKADGAVPSYKHFHPHMLYPTNYAFIKDEKQWLVAIREKEPFTDNRMEEYASNGTYYFRTGAIVKKYFKELMDKDVNLKGEYYVSLVYNLMTMDGLKTSVYEVQHMLQWGIPEDLEEYQNWSNYFANLIQPHQDYTLGKDSILLIPLAGHGSRFSKEGYKSPKPLLPISGKPMVVQAAKALPQAQVQVFVCLDSHLEGYPLKEALLAAYPQAEIISLDHVTEGQAKTCEIGLAGKDPNSPVIIGACDNAMLYNSAAFKAVAEDETVDAAAFTFRNHPSSSRNPQMYGWVKTAGDVATGVSVKVPISETPEKDHAVVGAFYFRKSEFFFKALKKMEQENIRVNGEFYVDSMIGELTDLGHKVKVFEVEDYICWGTPDDYRTFEYWQSFFHKCPWHPYRLSQDPSLEADKLKELEAKYTTHNQDFK
ncbi:MAG: NTP transferase domain-containing protein [SAR324 cluster bacterium]|nr:NTP transferase domain-containing protein [SAR324 cluster bacterium]